MMLSFQRIKNLFDWTPVAVKKPCPKFAEYKDVGVVLLGYEVEVQYLHHGTQHLLFAVDEEKLGLSKPADALKRATNFYNAKMRQIARYNEQHNR